MEKLQGALEILGRFKDNKEWKGFFDRAKRAPSLKEEINTEWHVEEGEELPEETELDREAKVLKKWMNENRDKFAEMTGSKDEYDAVHDVVSEIDECSWFQSRSVEPE